MNNNISIFAMPKPFKDEHINIIQQNAIKSWTLLNPRPEIILLGDEEGTKEIADKFKIKHIPYIECNEFGTPLLNSIFEVAQFNSLSNILAYINADIILMNDFIEATEKVIDHNFDKFLMIGRRWDFDLIQFINFQGNSWEYELRNILKKNGILHAETGIDYFIFTKNMWGTIPPFALGRTAWDNWLVLRALNLKMPVIDATQAITAIHQDHDYSHLPCGKEEAWNGTEAKKNLLVRGGYDNVRRIAVANWTLLKQQTELSNKYGCGKQKSVSIIHPISETSITLQKKRLKFLQIHTFYAHYLEEFYKKNPSLSSLSFKKQTNALIQDGFSGIHIFAPYMNDLGYETQFIVANNPYSQKQWLNENHINFNTDKNWIYEITRYQVESFKPDVLYLSEPITFDSCFVRSLSWKPSLIMGWRAANIPAGTDWSEFDVMLSNLSSLREMSLKLGAKVAENFFPGFPVAINEMVRNIQPQFDLVFSGQWTLNQHPRRNRYLTEIAKAASQPGHEFSCAYYLSGQVDKLSSEAAKYNLGTKYGLDMYCSLRLGRIGFDARGILEIRNSSDHQITDLAGKETANMRIFETTGVGIFLLTEYFENLKYYFEPGREIETFRDEKELIEKIQYYLSHPYEREAIARRGQERCLRDYSMEKRAVAFDGIIRSHLSKKSDLFSTPSLKISRKMDNLQHVIVASHRRSGTHLTIDSIINNFFIFSQNPDINKVTLDHLLTQGKQHQSIAEIQAQICHSPCILKTHSHGNIENFFSKSELKNFINKLFSNSKIIYVHRDGRDVLTSLYYYMHNFNEKIKNIPFSEFIRMPNDFNEDTYEGELNRVEYWQFHVRSWLEKKDILFLSFDDFHKDLHNTLIKISRFIGYPINSEIKDIRLSKTSLISKNQQVIRRSSVCFRQGQSGDWKRLFNKDSIEYFNMIAGETNQLLGYINNTDNTFELLNKSKALKKSIQNFSLIYKALDKLNTNNNAKALLLLNQAIALHPDILGLNYGKAVALARLGRIDEAIDTLKFLLSGEVKHGKARILLNELIAFSVSNLMLQASNALNANKNNEAFILLNSAKSFKKPIQDLDYLRAAYFSKISQPFAVKEALLEELRYFPNNEKAKNLLNQVFAIYPQLNSPKIHDFKFQNLYKIIYPYTMLGEKRLFSLFSLAKHICLEDIPGNFVECGVAAGGSTALLAAVIKKYSKRTRWLYAFDSFEGMPTPTEKDKDNKGVDAESTGWGSGTCAAPEESVKKVCTKLGVWDIVKTVKGYFESTLPQMRNKAGMIAFLHMDGDWYESTKTVLQNLYDNVADDGFIQVDDYGYWEGCRKAVHEFESSKKIHFKLNQIDDSAVWFQKEDNNKE
ncbi:O-methyltransferase [Candidatus Magnetomoraceae bacterium gMMP-13]